MNSNQGKVNFRWSVDAIKEHSRLIEAAGNQREAIQQKFEHELVQTVVFASRFEGAFVFPFADKVFVYGTTRDFNAPALHTVEECVVLDERASVELKHGLVIEFLDRKKAVAYAGGLNEHVLACIVFSHYMQVLRLFLSNIAGCVGEARIAKIVLARYRRGVEKLLKNDTDSEEEVANLSELIESLKDRLTRDAA